MAAEQRKLLKQLMSDNFSESNRDDARLDIKDPQVCRSFLVGACPHDLFQNTKNDLGACPRKHQEGLKVQFQAATEEQKREWGFEYDYQRDLRRHIDQCDYKIRDAERRLQKTPEEVRRTKELLEQVSALNAGIEVGNAEVVELAAQEETATAYADAWKIQQMHVAKEECERELKDISDNRGSSGHQKLQVCDLCGAYLSRLDNDRRLADHFSGKLHIGFANMRKALAELDEKLKGSSRAPARKAGEYDMGPLPVQNAGDGPPGDSRSRDYGGRGGYGGGGRDGYGGGGRDGYGGGGRGGRGGRGRRY